MTPEEALQTCHVALDYIGAKYNKEAKTHKDFYEGLLATLKQRADIGLMAEAIEKQIPEKSADSVCKRCGTSMEFVTANLGNPIGHPVVYCWNCGQAIDWRSENG